MGEVSKGYASHQLDGASAVKRDINKKMIKNIHMQWIRSEGVFSSKKINNYLYIDNNDNSNEIDENNDRNDINENNNRNNMKVKNIETTENGQVKIREETTWIHFTELDGFHHIGYLSKEQRNQKPYFTISSSSNDGSEYDNQNNKNMCRDNGKGINEEKEKTKQKSDFTIKEGAIGMGMTMRDGQWIVEIEDSSNNSNLSNLQKIIAIQDEIEFEWDNINEIEEIKEEEEKEEEEKEEETKEEEKEEEEENEEEEKKEEEEGKVGGIKKAVGEVINHSKFSSSSPKSPAVSMSVVNSNNVNNDDAHIVNMYDNDNNRNNIEDNDIDGADKNYNKRQKDISNVNQILDRSEKLTLENIPQLMIEEDSNIGTTSISTTESIAIENLPIIDTIKENSITDSHFKSYINEKEIII